MPIDIKLGVGGTNLEFKKGRLEVKFWVSLFKTKKLGKTIFRKNIGKHKRTGALQHWGLKQASKQQPATWEGKSEGQFQEAVKKHEKINCQSSCYRSKRKAKGEPTTGLAMTSVDSDSNSFLKSGV